MTRQPHFKGTFEPKKLETNFFTTYPTQRTGYTVQVHAAESARDRFFIGIHKTIQFCSIFTVDLVIQVLYSRHQDDMERGDENEKFTIFEIASLSVMSKIDQYITS